MKRRMMIAGMLCSAALPLRAATGSFEITRTDAEWREMLTPVEYAVMREEATETAFSSPLDTETRSGTYNCKGCDLPLYSSEHKYDSGTGWPSFWQSLPDAVGTRPDNSLFATRTEVHCRRCGSHLGHIFDDGPEPTGKRHCLNGVSLTFRAA
ncbi:peptide-methionine (R)-S-oxide reductase MsrB [Aliiroseovarius sp.]|uniref:peptide-methionine (R)-S-oxide reductase MsrB n=1 Tax=Aliiroseovarius sp. TaxID=1872442 RepID=UPI003BAA51F1